MKFYKNFCKVLIKLPRIDEAICKIFTINTRSHPHSTVILKEYFENIPLKSCNIAKIFVKLLERFLKYCRNLAMSVQSIINGILLQY